MKLKAYDKYHKHWIYIETIGDEIYELVSSSNRGVQIKVNLLFSAVEGDKDSCDPKRWSDFEQVEIVSV